MTARRTIGALLLAAVLALAGCGRDEGGGGGAAEQSAAIAEGPATGEITVWAMGTEGELLPKLAAEFQKENPEATVKVTAVPWDGAHDKISTAIAGRQTPTSACSGPPGWASSPVGVVSTRSRPTWSRRVTSSRARGTRWR